ncbi:hypothetical protein FSP39_007134 [Pinctada imbricata]|uniref:Bridge-like lipid transfer protein family member 1 N-terminal domain-containing protein n=1 Tax=Pinctada imbricata TaxID=66713 RepID=A0AA88YHR2_PINIB|nr:hypothetical protein FSP39_007134 [Pinctada imbricata]
MFRDFHWISHDFSVRIQYGWLIFKWWKPFVPKELKEDLSHMETRVVTFLDGFEFHVYNRSQNYSRLQKMFTTGTMMPEEEVKEESIEETTDKTEAKKKETPVSKLSWRDLVPVIKATVASGRFVFGNHLAPTQLIINFEDGHFTYTTKPPSTPFDDFMHDLTVRAENFKVMFVPSRNYVGPKDEAPRMMGEGFVVLQTRKIDLHYFMDQPGLVTYEIESVQMADGETIMRKTYPIFGMDVKCGKNTDVYYGPWADRQREYLWKFFYPADYQPMVPDKEPKPGEYRKFKKFEFVINLMEQATIEILFTKNEETQAIHMTASPGSYVEAMIPWLIDEDGYTTKVKGQLLIVDATTSLEYRSLVECETFEFNVTASYPSVWNEHQDWSVDFIVCKASVFLIFHHKHFFKGLIDDWSTTSVPDLYHFVPYTWTINLQIKDFELVLLSNEYNWIDTSSSYAENAHIAFCGSVLDLTLVLPYTDFMPKTVTMGLAIKGEDAFCRFYLPENNTSRHVVMAISKNLKLMDREGNLIEEPFKTDKKHWRNFTKESDGWIDCWCTKNVAISINYTYHPMPPLRQYSETSTPDQSRVTSPDQEEKLLHPLRPPRTALPTGPPEGFDPGLMDHDLIALELEVAPSMLCVYGSLLRNFLHVKENYLGEDQDFADFYGTASNKAKDGGTLGPLLAGEMEDSEPFDVRDHRPFAVTVSVAIHDIHGHLVKNCNMENLPCPSVLVERLCFEMDKNYSQTKLQLLLSPAVLIAKDTFQRSPTDSHLGEGHLGLSGLQVRGHAMFSHEGLPLDSETLEYGWLIEAIIGDLTGKLTVPQLQNLIEFIQTFIMLVDDPENRLQHPKSYKLCQHMIPQPQCRMLSKYPFNCPASEDIKYEMIRVSVDSVNLFLVESATAMNIQVFPVKLSTCNLHGTNTRAGITARVEHISLQQYVASSALKQDTNQQDLWLESGSLVIGPIDVEAAMALPNPDYHSIQDAFLKLHDKKTKRLWFLWPVDTLHNVLPIVNGKCGCLGGCVFFGNNKNGIGFFNLSKSKENTHCSAVLQISPDGQDPGFGQSLLCKDRLVFDVQPNNWSFNPR